MTTRAAKVAKRGRRKAKKREQQIARVLTQTAQTANDTIKQFSETLNASAETTTLTAAGAVDVSNIDADDDSVPRFTVTAYHGGLLDLPTHDLPVVIDLEGMELPASGVLPMLFNHSHNDVVGQADSFEQGTQLVLSGLINGSGPRASEVVANARKGFQWQASVGAKPTAPRQLIEAGKSINVNGQDVTGPFYLYPKTRLSETSFVPVGADRTPASAVIASAESQGSDMTFSAWLKSKGIDESKLEAAAKTLLEAQYKSELTASAGTAASGGSAGAAAADTAATGTATLTAAGGDGASLAGDEDIARIRTRRANENRRIAAIEAGAEQYGQQSITLNASGEFDPEGETRVDLASHAIEAGWDVNTYRLAARRNASPQGVGNDTLTIQRGNFDAHVIEAAVALSAGIPADMRVFDPSTGEHVERPLLASSLGREERQRVLNAATSQDYQGWGLVETMNAVCLLAGSPYRGVQNSDSHWRHYVDCQRNLQASGGTSTISLPGILGNTANKSLLLGYRSAMVKWPRLGRVMSANDFKVQTMYRMTVDGTFRKTGPDGKIQHGRLKESSFTNQLDTYGRKLHLNRQMRINNDLNSFTTIPQDLGLGGARALEAAVFSLWLANTGSFFASGNSNLLTSTAFDSDGLTAARKNFAHHVDQYGQPILAEPSFLLVPVALQDDAEVLLTSRNRITGAASTQPERNVHEGKLAGGVVASAYLDNTNIKDANGDALSGQSATSWYLVGDPNSGLAAMHVAFLNGQQSPVVQTDNGTFDNDGIEMEAYFDFGVSFGDPEAATKCTA